MGCGNDSGVGRWVMHAGASLWHVVSACAARGQNAEGWEFQGPELAHNNLQLPITDRFCMDLYAALAELTNSKLQLLRESAHKHLRKKENLPRLVLAEPNLATSAQHPAPLERARASGRGV